MRVLIAHPGTQYAPHLARELEARGLLHRFWTGFAIAQQSWLGALFRMSPKSVSSRLASRLMALPPHRLKTAPRLDWQARRAAHRVGDETAFFERNRRFQELIPDSELQAADIVIGFDTSSWLLAERARVLGKRFILDQSIGHPAAKERTFQTLRQRYPAWSTSVPQKAEELMAAERREHELAHRIVVPSRFVEQTLIGEGVPKDKIHIIPFGTDLELFSPAKVSRPCVAAPAFLFVGSLSARKGLPVLLEAWRQLKPVDAELWLAGAGSIPAEERAALPATVKLLGNQSRQQVADLMRQADVFVFPSFFEGLAQVQIEALASGLPLIGTIESGATELTEEGKNGFVVAAGDAAALADRIRQLIADPTLRASLRAGALASRERLSWTIYGDRWAQFLAEVAAC